MIIREPTPPEALPDEFDPNNYCRQCNRIYTTTENYRQHLKRAHKMVLVRLSKRILDLNISPNPNDANNHCASCNRTYSSRRSYQLYLEGIHKKNCTKNSKSKAQFRHITRYWNNRIYIRLFGRFKYCLWQEEQ